MRQLILLFSVLFSLQMVAQVNVTFRVNMQNVSGFTTPEVNGTFNGWCGNCNPMTDANGDNIWEVTIPLAAGSYEYKFSADAWGSQENLTPGSSCTVTNFGYTNRSLNVSSSDVVLPVVCWGSCDNCSSVFPVTFQVDMTQQTGFTTPEVNGSFNGWCGSCNPMTDANSDGIWQTTLYLSPGSYEYKFSADGWGSQENLTPGSSCTTTNFGYTNRTLTVGNSAVTQPVVCWGSCVACNQVLPSYNVTFRVDMSQQSGFTTPEVNGTFNNWCGASCNPMTDANGDNVWETTIALQAGSYEYKFAVDNWTSSEQLTDGSSCTVTNGGYVNRSLTVSNNATLDIVCYGTCSACIVSVPGCTNSTAANYNPAATVDNGSCLYNTTFNVDMACAGVSYTNVYVTGPWCGWCGAEAYNLLTDANGDGIYSGTVQLAAGTVEYKYMVDNWTSQENLVDDMQNGGTCAPITDYSNYANRQGTIGSTFNDVYGRCSACPAAVYNVTFQVDMSQQSGFTTVNLNGNFNGWCGPCNPMTDANSDGIWEITLPLAAGTYEYKFTADGWNMQENLTPGSSCTVTNFGYTNRSLTVTNSNITQPVVCWGSCSACSAPSYNVTFQVDMSQQTGFNIPELNGTFNGWCGNCTPLSDANGDNIWETTIALQAGTYEYKFSADGWGSQENLTPGSSCTVTNFGYTNRVVTVTNANITQPVVCWGSCSACVVSVPGCTNSTAANFNPAATVDNGSCLYNTTFNVDMACAGVSFTNVYVTGPWCGWCGAEAYNVLTDANGDGIYSGTVQLPAGTVEYKYMVDNWASQENLVDDMQNGGTCAPVTDYWSYANRTMTAGTTANNIYGRCSACTYPTTFNVDMSCAGVSFTNVYVTGPWCGWCGAEAYNVLTDANGDGIYSVTVELPAGTVEYKYMVDNWASQENLVDDMQNGATCAPVTDYWSYANRTSTVGGSTNDVYGRCSACPILGCMNATACNYNALATQDDGSCVLPSLTFYTDADGDGYGAGSGTQYCSNPGAGYSSNNQDCNDALAAVRPGVSEVCSTNYDDNCNGQINEGCTAVPGDEPSNAASIAQSQWPNCSSVSGTLVGATASSSAQTICLTGEDKWHQFVATSEAISIQVNSSAFDAVIELQSASGALVGSENAVSGIGSEILNIGGLTAGQVYKVGVRNYNSANGNGTYTICVKKLKRGGCDYGPGPYTLCQYFKASWAGGSGAQYRFTFTGLSGAASGNVYTKTQSSDICVLSSVTPTLPYGSNYNVLITTIYSLADGAGNIETIEVPALSPCSLTTSPEATSQLRASDNCSAGPRFRSAVVASLPWSCGAVNWRWEFIEVDASLNAVGLPIYFNRGTASNYLNLGTVASLQYGKTYAVRTAPIFTYTGSNYNWGPVQYMCIVGQSGFVTEGEDQTTDFEKVENIEFNATLFPNPTQGNESTLQLATSTDGKIYVQMYDNFGKLVFEKSVYGVAGGVSSITLPSKQLNSGLYQVQIIGNGTTKNLKLLVQH